MKLESGFKTIQTDFSLHEAERVAIVIALNAFRGQSLASVAKRLGVSRYTLNRLIRVHELEAEMYRSWPKAFKWMDRANIRQTKNGG